MLKRLEAVPGAGKAKLSRLARTEIRIAETVGNDEAAVWREMAHQHYCEAFDTNLDVVHNWSDIDFDALVPPIDR